MGLRDLSRENEIQAGWGQLLTDQAWESGRESGWWQESRRGYGKDPLKKGSVDVVSQLERRGHICRKLGLTQEAIGLVFGRPVASLTESERQEEKPVGGVWAMVSSALRYTSQNLRCQWDFEVEWGGGRSEL